MPLIYAGIDEAGYGPLLGPLCVGMAVVRVERWAPGDPAPDLWTTLADAVARSAKEARDGRVPIADSKKLKLANTTKTRHPLCHLERGVLAALAAGAGDAARPTPPSDDAALLRALGAELPADPWYRGDPVPLPLDGTAAELGIAVNRVRRALADAGVSVLAVRAEAVGESAFNATVRRAGSKAATTADAIGGMLREVAARWGRGPDGVRVVCDRQSGRTDYRPLLRAALPEARWGTAAVSERDSRYAAPLPLGPARPGKRQDDAPGMPDAELGVHFAVEAEDAHLPVALASMTAKLVRELAMLRFNRYWSARGLERGLAELKPTAGYRQDARRWLADASEIVTDAERETMTRIA